MPGIQEREKTKIIQQNKKQREIQGNRERTKRLTKLAEVKFQKLTCSSWGSGRREVTV